MNFRCFTVLSSAAGLAFALQFAAAPALAIDDAPAKPKIDCTKPQNKKKAACQDRAHPEQMTDEEIVNAGYWLSREGKYAEALQLLAAAKDQSHYRVLTATGFATRKVGNVDAALPLYAKALAANPDYVQAREYLGEAYLTKGDRTHAFEQLGEIEKRCGTQCVAYTELERQIGLFDQGQSRG